MNIEIACKGDYDFLQKHDRHIDKYELISLLERKRIYVIKDNEKILGWLRWNLFWDNTPFMNMLYILEPYRRQGFGRQLVEFWELHMEEAGYKFVMTSSLSDEQAQHFYRKLGYKDSGSLLLKNEPLEIIFTKYFTDKQV